jgi:hypothetical protein
MTSKPAPSSELRLGAAISTGSRPGSASRRRLHASGWMTTGSLTGPNSRTSPSMPPTCSKWPWLKTTASTSRGESSSRRMFSTSPSGEIPVSNSSLCSRPRRTTLTSAEKPCSARSASNASPKSSTGAGTRGSEPITGCRAGPSSTNNMSTTLSTSTVTDNASTGSSVICSILVIVRPDQAPRRWPEAHSRDGGHHFAREGPRRSKDPRDKRGIDHE